MSRNERIRISDRAVPGGPRPWRPRLCVFFRKPAKLCGRCESCGRCWSCGRDERAASRPTVRPGELPLGHRLRESCPGSRAGRVRAVPRPATGPAGRHHAARPRSGAGRDCGRDGWATGTGRERPGRPRGAGTAGSESGRKRSQDPVRSDSVASSPGPGRRNRAAPPLPVRRRRRVTRRPWSYSGHPTFGRIRSRAEG
jgi:hypothetical protein